MTNDDVGAAPHPPAGTFSPYSDGVKGIAATSRPFLQRRQLAKIVGDGVFLPVTIRGEMPGRAMRGRRKPEAIALLPPTTSRFS
ncbi:MAG: hypothetical protein EOR48_23520 [Mesorhizobium sp.]|nr:MAG: hypothetical protein EOR48_23520 [Mesorhizobium sp.]TIP42718.1 MAG: hypothetical protein E5X62_20970 [Mesorhizobium sp.]